MCVCVCGVRVCGGVRVWKNHDNIWLPHPPLSGAMIMVPAGKTGTETTADPGGPTSPFIAGITIEPPRKSLTIIKLSVVFTGTVVVAA